MTHAQVLQHEIELNWFADLLAQEGVRSYLEIGAKFGGSVAAIAARLPAGATIVVVDLPNGTGQWARSRDALLAVMKNCRNRGQQTHLIWGDSTDPSVVEQVHALGPFDAVFIDANHTLPYCTADWNNYGPLGRIVAFHDIAWHRPSSWPGTFRIDVPKLWNEIKTGYRHEERKLDPTGRDNGIGVLWRRDYALHEVEPRAHRSDGGCG